jgi:two-component system cell cycle response regulator DivK
MQDSLQGIARVLYVEDNPQNMRLVRKILVHAGYQVLEAETGLTGLMVAEQERPDLILMDINLPDIDGLEATTRLKNTPHLAHIPVIALTANAMVGDRERTLAAGCDGYLPKPVARQDLLDTVAGLLPV